jgi:hypothetical protein
MHDQRTCVQYHYWQCERCTRSDRRQHARNTTLHCKAVVKHACTQRTWTAPSHIRRSETQCSNLNAHATAQTAIAILLHSTLVTALEAAAAMHAQDAHCASSACSQCAHDTAATILAFSQSSRTPHAHINLLVPRSPPPSHHAHAAQRHVSTTARVTQNTARQQDTHGTSHTPTQHTKQTSPTRPQDVPHSHDNSALRQHHCAHPTARTQHTAPRTTHTAHGKPQPVTHAASHTHVRAVRLPSVGGMLPESWLLFTINDLQDT